MRKRAPFLIVLILLILAVLVSLKNVRDEKSDAEGYSSNRLNLPVSSGSHDRLAGSQAHEMTQLEQSLVSKNSASPPAEELDEVSRATAEAGSGGGRMRISAKDFAVVYRSRVVGDGKVDELTERQFQSALRAICEKRRVAMVIDAGVETTSMSPFVVSHTPQFDITDEVRQEYRSIQATEKAASK